MTDLQPGPEMEDIFREVERGYGEAMRHLDSVWERLQDKTKGYRTSERDKIGKEEEERELERRRPSPPREDEYEWRAGDLRRKKTHRGYGSTQYESKANDSMASLMENWRSYEKKTLLTEQDSKVNKVAKALSNPKLVLTIMLESSSVMLPTPSSEK